MKQVTNGTWLIVIGIAHQLVGIATGVGLLEPPASAKRSLFREIAADKLIGAIEVDVTRVGFFWFLFFGWLLLMFGGLIRTIERRQVVIPSQFGWHLGAMALVGVLLIPLSGFWLLFPIAWRLAFRKAGKHPVQTIESPAHGL